jgi:shikimate dehydrogenase
MSEEIAQRITGHTELLALIAYPIRHSGSPRMHNLALAKLGLNYAYLCFDVDSSEFKSTIDAFRVLKVRGWNVSMPNKVDVIKYLDKTSAAVDLIGACNTVINDNGVLTGENTDGLGYVAALRDEGVDLKGKKLTLFGAGGAAMAIATQVALDGAGSIDIFNQRDAFYGKAEETAAKICSSTACKVTIHDQDNDVDRLRASIASAAVLANASKIGFKGELEDFSPLRDTSMLRPDLFVSDAVYAPLKTKLLKQAEAAGCRCMSGIPMMLQQGAASFKMWTGKDMPLDYVKERLFA